MGLFLAKNVDFGLDPNISDANTDPFIPFGANLFVYFNHIGIQITLNITVEIISCVWENLSPVLFSLFLNNLEEFLRIKNNNGIEIEA